jgi:hypothetical protein
MAAGVEEAEGRSGDLVLERRQLQRAWCMARVLWDGGPAARYARPGSHTNHAKTKSWVRHVN